MAGKRYTADDDAIITRMWSAGANLAEIGRAVGRSPKGIQRRAREALQLEPRELGRPRKHDWRPIGQLLDEGMRTSEAARRCGVSYQVARYVRAVTCAEPRR